MSTFLRTDQSPFRVKVRSATVAACKDATSKEKNSRYLNFIPLVKKVAVGLSRNKKEPQAKA